MDDRTVDLIFAGSLESLPPVSSKIVRIFTSSTFTGRSRMCTFSRNQRQHIAHSHFLKKKVDLFSRNLRHNNGAKQFDGEMLSPDQRLLQREAWT